MADFLVPSSVLFTIDIFFTRVAVRPLNVGDFDEDDVDATASSPTFSFILLGDLRFKCKIFNTLFTGFRRLVRLTGLVGNDWIDCDSESGSIGDALELAIWPLLQLFAKLLFFTKSMIVSSDENDARAT